MIKTILISLLGVFFIINGINHFYNRYTLEKYAKSRGLMAPRFMVTLSGVFLILGGLSLITGILIYAGIAGLCLFLLIASFSIHKFWRESDKQMMMIEFAHFLKNWAIIFELVYIAETLSLG
jgi:putative oxidoreductase